ncbi:hypothetical protein Taro_025031 [Colocasia esculenta]|uniref:Copper-fist domain-containing protein n=1 Tax=Colocasia esculenta TaxID=4460 RepID=A0A843V944_COLES|nr:hypothetical protein [Colocasia esculenta]
MRQGLSKITTGQSGTAMASRGRRGGVPACEGEQRREEQAEQQAPAPQGPEGEMQQYLEEKKASQKRPAATFQWQDKKKAVYQAPQHPVTTNSAQVPSQRSPGVKKECPHCGKTHGGTECWMIAGKSSASRRKLKHRGRPPHHPLGVEITQELGGRQSCRHFCNFLELPKEVFFEP